jgi:hypothetical protein
MLRRAGPAFDSSMTGTIAQALRRGIVRIG